MTNAELVHRILAGEDNLFAELVNRYAGCVWAICSAHIFNRSDCEDVAQDVFIQSYLRLATIRRPAAFGRWISQVARRHCLEWLRAASRRKAAMTRYEEHACGETAQGSASVDDRLALEELQQTIAALVRTLPPKSREALLLCYSEGYSAAEAAELLGISREAMKKRLQRGRKLLAAKVGDEIEPALAAKRHTEDFTRAALAAIPFGSAAWLGTAGAGTTAAASQLGAIGGTAIMAKKVIVTIGVVALLLLAGYSLLNLPGGAVDEGEPQRLAARGSTDQSETDTAAGVEPRDAVTSAYRLLDPVEPEPAASAEEQVPGQTPAGDGSEPSEENDEDDQEPPAPASVSGHVMDADGYPFPGAAVRLEVAANDTGLSVSGVYETKTGEDGRYQIVNIDTFGRGFAYASAKGHLMQKRSGLAVSQGANLQGIDFMLVTSSHAVAGRVVSESGDPISGTSVNLRYFGYDEEGIAYTAATGGTTGSIGSSPKFVFAITDDAGRFEIAVGREGLCDFTVIKEGYGPGYFPKIPTGTRDALFVLEAMGAITGTVTLPDGSPLDGEEVVAEGRAYPGGLTPTEHLLQPLRVGWITVLTNTDGVYVLDGLGEDYHYDVSVVDAGEVVGYKKGVRVRAGETTTGVDFVVHRPSRVFGVVTDATTGLPIHRVAVYAQHVESSGDVQPSMIGWSETTPDGYYSMKVPLDSEARIRIGTYYLHPCGTNETTGGIEPLILSLKPGADLELDLTIDAPITIPIRVVDENGLPLEGTAISLKDVERDLTWMNDRVVTDADGRFVWHGLPARQPYVARAIDRTRTGPSMLLGQSGSISGQPGETVPEVVIACVTKGGVEGFILDADGSPVALAQIECRAVSEDGSLSPIQRGGTDEQGAFCVLRALPEGVHPAVLVGRQTENGYDVGIIENVEIERDKVINLGIIHLDRHFNSLEEAAQSLGMQ